MEGAWLEDGKDLSIWDAFSHTSGRITNGDHSEVACDHYHRLEEDGVNVQGYFCWTLMDNFEWTRRYNKRFGLIYCDFETLERTPKRSFAAYRDLIT